MATVLSISSQVLRGTVGNNAAVPALQRLGHEVWPLPTVALPHHRGYDRDAPALTMPAERISAFAAALQKRGWLARVDAILVGYIADPDQAGAIADAIDWVRAARGDIAVLVDPVLGDEGRLYVSEAVARAVRDRLMPRADMTTPNAFELSWLAGIEPADTETTIVATRKLRPAECLVTSAPGAPRGRVRNLLVTAESTHACDIARIEHPAHGTGDLLAACYLGWRLNGQAPHAALSRATGALRTVIRQTGRCGDDELALTDCLARLTASRPARARRLA